MSILISPQSTTHRFANLRLKNFMARVSTLSPLRLQWKCEYQLWFPISSNFNINVWNESLQFHLTEPLQSIDKQTTTLVNSRKMSKNSFSSLFLSFILFLDADTEESEAKEGKNYHLHFVVDDDDVWNVQILNKFTNGWLKLNQREEYDEHDSRWHENWKLLFVLYNFKGKTREREEEDRERHKSAEIILNKS